MIGIVQKIYRFPVKGLSEDSLQTVKLCPGEAIHDDRRFALLASNHGNSGEKLDWKPKTSFLALVRHQKLAALETQYDDKSTRLTIRRRGIKIAEGKLANNIGRAILEEFFAAYLGSDHPGKPVIVEASTNTQTLSDQSSPLISIINQASIKDLERVARCTINPLRFRPNFLVDLKIPWAEMKLTNQELSIGETILVTEDPIDRCAAINVNPQTSERDLNLINVLKANFGHIDFGVFARVKKGGSINVGSTISLN